MEDVVSIRASFYGTHGKRLFERKRLRWCNIKIDLKKCYRWTGLIFPKGGTSGGLL